MSIILSIDTSSKNCSVSLSKDGVLISVIEENNESFSHANNLHFFCEKIIKKTNLNLSDVDAYAFAYGKQFPKKPTLGCGVVLDGGRTAIFIPMDLGSKIVHI